MFFIYLTLSEHLLKFIQQLKTLLFSMIASYKLYYQKWNSCITKLKNVTNYLLYDTSKSKSLKWSIMLLSLGDENIVNTDTLFGIYVIDIASIASEAD